MKTRVARSDTTITLPDHQLSEEALYPVIDYLYHIVLLLKRASKDLDVKTESILDIVFMAASTITSPYDDPVAIDLRHQLLQTMLPLLPTQKEVYSASLSDSKKLPISLQ